VIVSLSLYQVPRDALKQVLGALECTFQPTFTTDWIQCRDAEGHMIWKAVVKSLHHIERVHTKK